MMNKFDYMNVVLVSELKAEDKALLVELLLRADDKWECWPSVQRLCMVRGMKHEKNFKGVDVYLPGLVTKQKRGRKNFYRIDRDAVANLGRGKVVIKYTPPLSDAPDDEADSPAAEDNTPAVEVKDPVVRGANTSLDTTKKSSENTTETDEVAGAPSSVTPTLPLPNKESSFVPSSSSTAGVPLGVTTEPAAPATGGVLREEVLRAIDKRHPTLRRELVTHLADLDLALYTDTDAEAVVEVLYDAWQDEW